MAAMPPFLSAQWYVGVGVGGVPSRENFEILGPNSCILGYFFTLCVLILADIMRHSLL